MKRLLALSAAIASLSVVLAPLAANATPRASGQPAATTCTSVPVSNPSGARVESVTAVARPAGTVSFPDGPLGSTPSITDVPARCEITVTLSHSGAGDEVTVKVALPQDPKQWNGRFLGTGGSTYQAGDLDGPTLVSAVRDGYAAAATDAGVGQDSQDVSGWALTSDGTVDRQLLKNFAGRSLHDAAVVGKDVTKKFYGNAARYAYFNGCSTGGRQGYIEAQQYPRDYQGILANAPAVSWDRFAVATLWPQVVFNEENLKPSPCELNAFNAAAVKACDKLDGSRDGVIDNPQRCQWDPRRLVGHKLVDCDGETFTVTAALADVVRKIWEGPVSASGDQLWYGPNRGADFTWLANPAQPFVVADEWVKYFVQQDPQFDTQHLTYQRFERIFRKSQASYNSVIGTDSPDLSAFAAAGGKFLSWHGQSDQLVPTRGTIDYREHVNQAMGGNKQVDDFYRLFLLPGVDHCATTGPKVTGDLEALTRWVERGKAPRSLTLTTTGADGVDVEREICRYPLPESDRHHDTTRHNHRC